MSRARPPHQVQKLNCRECGAPIDVKDERTQMLVCTYCGSALQLSGTEQEVLERHTKPRTDIPFRIELGERIELEDASYEVIARVCIIEPGEFHPAEHTYQYYLYHPSREPRWLSEYGGTFDLTQRTRVRLRDDPFESTQQTFEGFDGRRWRLIERATTEVHYVDGALPYVQRVGDRYDTIELRGVDAYDRRFEVSRPIGVPEIEYGEGRALSNAEVEAGLGRALAAPTYVSHDSDAPAGLAGAAAAVTPYLFGAGVFLGLVCLGLGAMLVLKMEPGHEVLYFQSHPADLAQNTMSDVFEVRDDDDILRIQLSAPLDNAWMYAQVALVAEDGDTVLHVTDSEFGAYHGRDSEGSWTEGSQTSEVYVRVEDAGLYRLMLGGASGYGESSSTQPQHSLEARVYRNAGFTDGGFAGLVITVVLGLLGLVLISRFSRYALDVSAVRRRARVLVAMFVVVIAGTGSTTAYALATDSGVPELEHPDGVSIRQSSVDGQPNAPFFFVYNSPRHFLGGGVHGGK